MSLNELDDATTNSDKNEFDGGEFVLTRTAGGGFVGGGYKIRSRFLDEDVPAITTYNDDISQVQNNVSDLFQHLAIPAGLFYANMKRPVNSAQLKYTPHIPATDDIMDKLFELVEMDKKRQKKYTKKHKSNGHKSTRRRLVK
jgi:hypothetical protein